MVRTLKRGQYLWYRRVSKTREYDSYVPWNKLEYFRLLSVSRRLVQRASVSRSMRCCIAVCPETQPIRHQDIR